ncbi:MAG: flagellar basal body-associated FliL family protein [Methyloprofundus sp.]|nr:flagellar basal body-associated FliL family protein [Methyloprofundus sp.]
MHIFLLLSLLFLPSYVAAEDEAEPIEYVDMRPDFIVNLSDSKNHMRASIQLMVSGSDAKDNIKKHLPAIRHSLLLKFGDLTMEQLQTTEQREKLRADALDLIKKTLKTCSVDDSKLLDVFFTEFLVQ